MSQTKFGFVMPQGWRWLDPNGCSPAEQYCFVKDIINSAEHLGYATAYSFDHLMGGANYKCNRKKNFFECLYFSLLCSISHQVFVLGNWSPATRIEIPLCWLRWSLQWRSMIIVRITFLN
jgi:hypothetical protein